MQVFQRRALWVSLAFGILCIAGGIIVSLSLERPLSVIIVSLDGARGDRTRDDDLPNIHRLASKGSFTYTAHTVVPSKTLPAHASLLTGYDVPRHGITWDAWTGQKISVPTLFDLLASRGKKSIVLFGKDKMRTLKPDGALWTSEVIEGGSRDVWMRAQKILAKGVPDVLFLHLIDPDRAGHDFGEQSLEYRAALMGTDAIIGELRVLLAERRLGDRIVLLITADHGMLKTSHGGTTDAEILVPWIIAGPGILKNHPIAAHVSIMDTVPTLGYLLDLPERKSDGIIIPEIFYNEPLWKKYASWLTSQIPK